MSASAEPQDPPNGLSDYDISQPLPTQTGLRKGLTSYGDAHFSLFLRKAFIKAAGYGEDALSRPVIGIVNTFSGFNPCHANVPQLLEALKRGIQLHGGLPIEFPTISLHESFSNPTSMFLRNLMSMDTEEMIRAQPLDAVVLIGGCDKTVPAQLMGALSADRPALPLSGTCGVMGTASTMACITAALGLMPLRGATAPAVSAARLRIAEETGKNAVFAAKSATTAHPLRPSLILTRESFLNAITVLQAIGGSTNAVVHLLAIINRHPTLAGTIPLSTFDDIGRRTPLLVDLKPSGSNYMTDFHNAGGMPALLHTLRPLLHLDAPTITGATLGAALDASGFRASPLTASIIRPLGSPLYPASSLVVLTGNLAPGGAVMKASASKDRRLLQHAGPAVVFADTADLARRVDDPALPVTRDSVLVCRRIGPRGHPGMPEAGLLPIPRKLARDGVADMVRVSDGRMSGTAGGTIVLHVSPEAKDAESVLGVVRDGDIVRLDVEGRRLELLVDEEEVARRIEERKRTEEAEREAEEVEARAAGRRGMRGYRALYDRCVNQAEQGADFDFLTAKGC
ncbi:Dihydroxy-acid dehydratase [Neofusicoccum parvum]|uniref:Dihydroxy-acid dehydratase n=1 Tax=Neofusicoccum parvum TaxID=310453 RepID=A0ACB5RRK7_9PEZI|nr:Dihydroxy-acid dehydratase [Neofusicoccum parvum]